MRNGGKRSHIEMVKSGARQVGREIGKGVGTVQNFLRNVNLKWP